MYGINDVKINYFVIYIKTKVRGIVRTSVYGQTEWFSPCSWKKTTRLLALERKQHLVRSVSRRLLGRANSIIQVAGLFPELKWPELKSYAPPKLRVHGALYQRPTRYHFVTQISSDNFHYLIPTYVHSKR